VLTSRRKKHIMTVSNAALEWNRQLADMLEKCKRMGFRRVPGLLQSAMAEVLDDAISSVTPTCMREVCAFPAQMQEDALLHLLYSLDTSSDYNPDEDGYCCVDVLADYLESNKSEMRALMADSTVHTAEDAYKWIERRMGIEDEEEGENHA
jgi:hypothetical protein